MAQIRKLLSGGQPTGPTTTESPATPQLLTVGGTSYNMDTYIRELENNIEGYLDSTDFSDKEKNEQRRLLPIFVQKLRSGVVTPVEGGGWRDASLEMYNQKKGHDKWGALAWFATEWLRKQKPYDPNASSASKDAVEYDPNKGLESLWSKIFGPSARTFISLDDFTDNTNTKRGLKNRSRRVFNALTDIRGNLDKYFTFKNPADRTDLENKIDYILGTVIGDEAAGTGNGLIDPNEHFYLSEIGLGDVTDLFATDSTEPSAPQQGNTGGGGGGGNDGTVVPPPGGGDLSYGSSFSADVMSSWISRSGDTYKVKKTPGINDLSFGSLLTIGHNTVSSINSVVTSLRDLRKLSKSIYEYFYNRKPGALKYDQLLDLFSGNLDLQGFVNAKPAEVVGSILNIMVATNHADLEAIGGNKYILSRTRSKNNTVLMYDSVNRTLSEVSAFYSPKFRQKVLNAFSAETGIIPTNIDWYSAYYKQGGILMAKGGANFYDTYYKTYYHFDPSVTGNENVIWDATLREGKGAYRPVQEGETGIPKAIVDQNLSYTAFNTFRKNAGNTNTNNYNFIGFDPQTASYFWQLSNIGDNNVELTGVYNKDAITLPKPGKETPLYRMNKSANDFSRSGLVSAEDEVFTGNWDNINEANSWITSTLDNDSGYAGIYNYDGKWYRTKTAPTTGTLLTASIAYGLKPGTKTGQLSHGPSNFDKFMQFFGPATGDIAAGIFTHQRNNRGLEKLKDAMHPNYKTMPLEVFDPLNINYSAYTAGHLRGIDIESRARESAANFNDPSLAVAANRQGTLDRIANDSTVDSTINQDLQTQILNRTTAQNLRNDLAAKTAYDNQVEDHRVELAKATAEVENDKTNTEVWNRIMAKYAGQIGDYFTANVTKKQETADIANKLQAQAWLDDTIATKKDEWKKSNPEASDFDWLLSPEYKRIKREFNRMIALGDAYTPWELVSSARNGGVLSLRTQHLLNKVVK